MDSFALLFTGSSSGVEVSTDTVKQPPEIQIEVKDVSSPSPKTKEINTDLHSILTEATLLPVPPNEPPTSPGFPPETSPKTSYEVSTVIPQTQPLKDAVRQQNLTFKPSHTSTFVEVPKHANPGSDWNLEHLSAGIASILGTPNLPIAPIVQETEEIQPDRQTKAFIPGPKVSNAMSTNFAKLCSEILGTGTIENTEQEGNVEDGGTFLDSHTGSEEILPPQQAEEDLEKSLTEAGEDVSEGGMGDGDAFTEATEDTLQLSQEELGTLLDNDIGKVLDLIEAGLELSIEDVLSSSVEKQHKPRESFGQRVFETGKPEIENPLNAGSEDLSGRTVCWHSWPPPGVTRPGPTEEESSLTSLVEPENVVTPTAPEATGQESDDVEDLSDVEGMKDNQLDLVKDVQEMTTARRPMLFTDIDLPVAPETRGSPEGALSDLETLRASQTLPAQSQSESWNLESHECREDTQEFVIARKRGSGDREVVPKQKTPPPSPPPPVREVDERLNQVLNCSFTCWTLAILMSVGFYHPAVFLIVGLYLLSLCF
ncbi:hypothetical protein AOXY_G32653 [Acipenser oxyrinchus oxyrinchus]|uniref:Uncharacterized protein n=1 Tax=Acipenser oxyrinchus oxyrinchus TaxID=40147 RepID=A0AAD8FNZ1_ACIOX|nr:hypothetical protein AOXY_G32653 [Acipenser oxyrinchus oxyrinchus]